MKEDLTMLTKMKNEWERLKRDLYISSVISIAVVAISTMLNFIENL